MITKIVMPQMSLTMQSGLVTFWYKQEGEYIKQGEPFCSIEGDKASVDVDAPVSGYVKKLVAVLGEEFPVKEAIAYLGDENDVFTLEESSVEKRTAGEVASSQPVSVTKREPGQRILISPAARRMAEEYRIDINNIIGTGPDGTIRREDIQKAIDSGIRSVPAEANSVERIKLVGIQKLVAEKMKASYLDAPHIHLSLHVLTGKINDIRRELNKGPEEDGHVSMTDIFLWAVGRTLMKHSRLNATLVADEIHLLSEINVGFAVATDAGLVVPIVRNTDHLDIRTIAKKRDELTKRTKENRQTLEDLSGGTFTITNLGMFGVEEFDPILSPGQAGILAIGKEVYQAVPDSKGDVIFVPVVKLTVACDHRIANGVDGARFLSDLKDLLENPDDSLR